MNNSAQYFANNLKIKHPVRNQMEFQTTCLDQLIPENHLVRKVWDFVDKMDTSPCYSQICSFCNDVGRSAISPKVLLTLWIYSILDGNDSARKLEELCNRHDVYKWIAGGISVSRTVLAEFRSKDSAKFDDLLLNCLAVLVKSGLVKDEEFSQDGTKVKANAGFNSFRREDSLIKIKENLQQYIKSIQNEAKNCLDAYEKKKLIKKEHFAKERKGRVDEALKMLDQARDEKEQNGIRNRNKVSKDDLDNVRASTTDPVVRKMRMGDSGYRLAYNIQFATGLDSRVIFGVDICSTLDPGTSPRMMVRVNNILQKLGLSGIKKWVCDSAYSAKDDIEKASLLFPDSLYYAPPNVKNGIDPKKAVKNDSEAVRKWRDLIGSKAVEDLYKKRCSTAEFSNAQIKRCLKSMLVRGFEKVRGMTLLHVIANNISRFLDLQKKSVVGMV